MALVVQDNVDWSKLPYEAYMIIMAHHCKNEKDYWGEISFKCPKTIKHRGYMEGEFGDTEQTQYHYQPIPRLRLFSCPQYLQALPQYRRGHYALVTDKEMKKPEYVEFHKLHKERQQQIKDNPSLGVYYKARNQKKEVIEQLKSVWEKLWYRRKAPFSPNPNYRDNIIYYYDPNDGTMYCDCPSNNCYLEKYKRYAIHPKHMKYKYLHNQFPSNEITHMTKCLDTETGDSYYQLMFKSELGYLHIGRDKNFENKKGYGWRQKTYQETYILIVTKSDEKTIKNLLKHKGFSHHNAYAMRQQRLGR